MPFSERSSQALMRRRVKVWKIYAYESLERSYMNLEAKWFIFEWIYRGKFPIELDFIIICHNYLMFQLFSEGKDCKYFPSILLTLLNKAFNINTMVQNAGKIEVMEDESRYILYLELHHIKFISNKLWRNHFIVLNIYICVCIYLE